MSAEKRTINAMAHTDQATTLGYIRGRETPVSEVVMRLPNGIK